MKLPRLVELTPEMQRAQIEYERPLMIQNYRVACILGIVFMPFGGLLDKSVEEERMRSAGVDTERGRPAGTSASTEAARCLFVCGDAKASVGVCLCVFSAAQRRRMKEGALECGRFWFCIVSTCVVVSSVGLVAVVAADSSSASEVRAAMETESGRLDPFDERRRISQTSPRVQDVRAERVLFQQNNVQVLKKDSGLQEPERSALFDKRRQTCDSTNLHFST